MQISIFAASALLALVSADNSPPSCGEGYDLCPSEYPCCAASGTCGNGFVCLGGCDPRFSNTPGSCLPMPVCQSNNYTMSNQDQFTNYTSYRGDASKMPFIYEGEILESNGDIRAVMRENNTATTITLNNYVWFGKVTLRMKASHGSGVISDFILLSDAKDEIDYELVGSKTTQAQTNYYWQGVLDYQNMIGADVSDVYQNYHEYEFDWTEDQITWSIDGNSVRTLKKSDTYNSTSGDYAFPQTPSRVQFGLWAAGDSPYQGTSEWAGGQVDWSAAGDDGYYFVDVSYLNVECYDPPSGTNSTGSKSYVYTNKNAMVGDVSITDDDTILESLDGTGENPCGSQCSSSSSSSKGTGATLSGNETSSKAGATLVGSQSSSKTDATLTGSESSQSSESTASASDSDSSAAASASASASGSAAGSGSQTGSATASSGSSLPTASASSQASQQATTGASSNAAAIVGVAAVLAPLAFIL